MTRVIATYEKSGVLLEKYDVLAQHVSRDGGSGGGEYPMQVGFGWTNGTLDGFLKEYPDIAADLLGKAEAAHPAVTGEKPRVLPKKSAKAG